MTATSLSRRRSAARLAAVQAIYEMELAEAPIDPLLGTFLADRWYQGSERGAMAEPDADLLMRGVAARRDSLDTTIDGALSGGLKIDRLEALLRAILRAGAYELSARREVPTKVVINEYVNVAHAFYAGKEPALVNAVLDRLASAMRGEDEEWGHDGRREAP
jgi:N utilization substance protein B